MRDLPAPAHRSARLSPRVSLAARTLLCIVLGSTGCGDSPRGETSGHPGSWFASAAAAVSSPGEVKAPALAGPPDTPEDRAAGSPVKFASRDGPKGVALIIAISDYGPPPSGMKNHRGQDVLAYRNLNAANDVPVIRAALQQHGFLPADIYELRDSDATREGILGAFEALVEVAGEGDAVVIHYSGHGHQITDDDGPHDELDGYDEVLVPYGAPAEFVEGYTGEYHIRDDTVGYYVQRLRERVGPTGNITIFLDACYSGTGTRSGTELPVRGGLPPLGPPHPDVAGAPRTRGGPDTEGVGFQVRQRAARDDAEARDGGTLRRRRTSSDDTPPVPREPSASEAPLAPFVVISASAHDEVAHEMYGPDGETIMGSLSYALAQALPRLREGDSYNTLFTYVTSALNGRVRQTPQIEGDRNAMVFGSELVRSSAPTVAVARIMEDGRIELDHGGLVGLNPASLVSFFPPSGDVEGLKPWARGAVVSASPTRSVVALEGAPPREANLLEARVFVERLAYGEQVVRVALDPSLPSETRAEIHRRLGDGGMVELVDVARGPEVIVGLDVVEGHLPDGERRAAQQTYVGQLAAVTVNESTPLTRPGAPAALVARRIEDWSRNQYLRRLQLDNPAIEVDFELAVVRHLGGDRCSVPDWSAAEEHPGFEGGGRWTLPAGTDYVLRVHNRSQKALHFAVIDLMPPGDTVTLVKALYPPSEQSAGATQLPPGQAVQIPATCFYTEPTNGSETLKLFVSEDPIPVDQLVGMRTRSNTRRSDVPMTATREIHLRVTKDPADR